MKGMVYKRYDYNYGNTMKYEIQAALKLSGGLVAFLSGLALCYHIAWGY